MAASFFKWWERKMTVVWGCARVCAGFTRLVGLAFVLHGGW